MCGANDGLKRRGDGKSVGANARQTPTSPATIPKCNTVFMRQYDNVRSGLGGNDSLLRKISVVVTSFVRLSVEVKLGRSDDEQVADCICCEPPTRKVRTRHELISR